MLSFFYRHNFSIGCVYGHGYGRRFVQCDARIENLRCGVGIYRYVVQDIGTVFCNQYILLVVTTILSAAQRVQSRFSNTDLRIERR